MANFNLSNTCAVGAARGLAIAFLLAGLGGSGSARAQALNITDSAMLDTIIVSARKRDESLASVPESITAFTAASLSEFDIRAFNDYATKTPNMSFAYGAGATGTSNARTVAIRGINGQNLFGTAGATGFYLDDTPIPASIDPRVVDMERIEILKGPQGTLFGESSLAGNVRLITKQPDLGDSLRYTAEAGLTAGGGADGGASVIANMLLIPGRLAIRAVFFGNHDAGYLRRTFPSALSPAAGDPSLAATRSSVGDQGAETILGGSVTTRFKASERFEARLRVVFQNTEDKGFPATFAPLPAFAPQYTLNRAFDIQPLASDTWVLPSLALDYRSEHFSVVSSTSYFYRRNRDLEDSTYGTQQILRGFYGVAALPNQPFLWDQEHRQNQLTEELRLSFDAMHSMSGTVGIFYSRARTRLSIPPTYARGLVTATANNIVVGPWPNNLLWTDYNPATQEDISLFGEIYWKFLNRFTATVGARKYRLRQTTDFTADGFNNFGPTLSNPQASQQTGLDPKFDLSYQYTDTAMMYASASKGFRAGGAQPFLPFCSLPTLPVEDITHLKSDTLWSYELGTKVQVPRTGLLISADVFHIDWNNLQQQVALPCGAYIVINGQAAKIDGAELEVTGSLTPSLQIRFSTGYEKTNITEPGPLSIVGILPGSRTLGTPAWTASLGGAYTHAIAAGLGFVSADYSYVGDSVSLLNSGGGALAHRASYVLANLRLGVRHDLTEVSLKVHNLTNAKPNLGDIGYVGYAQYDRVGASMPIIPQVATLQPLTVLLQYRRDF